MCDCGQGVGEIDTPGPAPLPRHCGLCPTRAPTPAWAGGHVTASACLARDEHGEARPPQKQGRQLLAAECASQLRGGSCDVLPNTKSTRRRCAKPSAAIAPTGRMSDPLGPGVSAAECTGSCPSLWSRSTKP